MKIQSSQVAMNSARVYSQSSSDWSSYSSFGNTYATTLPEATESDAITTKSRQLNLYQNYSATGMLYSEQSHQNAVHTDTKTVEVNSMQTEITELHLKSTVQKEMVGKVLRVKPTPISLRELLQMLIHRRREFMENMLGLSKENAKSVRVLNPIRVTNMNEYQSTYQEMEQTAFSSKGSIVTKDGKSISFDMQFMMSRSFTETMSMKESADAVIFTDPLVVNFGTGVTEFSDQKMTFDIDADGELDNISILSELCGYLALDRNGDGSINDGSELFGAKTGDGFAELAVFDLDGNGWIDENDEVFDKLRIWSKDSNGNDVLVGLGVRGIGAIYLGHALTEFTMMNEDMEVEAKVRSTGIFLKEDGTVGSIQQVDMAS